MTREELNALLDRVIGGKGILRTPAYWMRRVLNNILEYCEGLTPKIEVETEVNDSENPVSSGAVKTYVDTAIGDIDSVLDTINGEEI